LRDRNVTGVQTCALPISAEEPGDPAFDGELALDFRASPHPPRVDQLAGGDSHHETVGEEEAFADGNAAAEGPATRLRRRRIGRKDRKSVVEGKRGACGER